MPISPAKEFFWWRKGRSFSRFQPIATKKTSTMAQLESATPERSYRNRIQEAASAIDECNFLLVATGAGFSADSGLPTYTQVASNPVYEKQDMEYGDLCRVSCLKDRPSLFYGFWGTCYNMYQEASPHEGYHIVKKWCQEKSAIDTSSSSPFFHYTSNVDGYWRRVGLSQHVIHEMHGCISTWIGLSNLDEHFDGSSKNILIDLNKDFRFPVEPETLEMQPPLALACLESETRRNDEGVELNQSSSQHYRPRVLMFDDGFDAHKAMRLEQSSERYQAWEEEMESHMAANPTAKLVVLEIGCGIRVPSVRRECEDVIRDTAVRCNNTRDVEGGSVLKRCYFIRINPDNYEIELGTDLPATAMGIIKTISIKDSALKVCVDIQEELTRRRGSND